jgi:hypothetical protein
MVSVGNLIHGILFRNFCFIGITPKPCLFEEPGRTKKQRMETERTLNDAYASEFDWIGSGVDGDERGGADHGDEQRYNGYDGKCPIRFRGHEHIYNGQPVAYLGFGRQRRDRNDGATRNLRRECG